MFRILQALIHRAFCYLRFPIYLVRLRSWQNARWVLDYELNEYEG